MRLGTGGGTNRDFSQSKTLKYVGDFVRRKGGQLSRTGWGNEVP